MKSVIWTRRADQDLDRLSPEVARRMVEAIERYALTGRGPIRRLRGTPEDLRLRVGDWRVRFDEDEHSIVVTRIFHRSEGYD